MTLEEIKKGVDFANKAFEGLYAEDKGSGMRYAILIEQYQKAVTELLKMVEEKEDK